jgi:hypothetical protein
MYPVALSALQSVPWSGSVSLFYSEVIQPSMVQKINNALAEEEPHDAVERRDTHVPGSDELAAAQFAQLALASLEIHRHRAGLFNAEYRSSKSVSGTLPSKKLRKGGATKRATLTLSTS